MARRLYRNYVFPGRGRPRASRDDAFKMAVKEKELLEELDAEYHWRVIREIAGEFGYSVDHTRRLLREVRGPRRGRRSQ